MNSRVLFFLLIMLIFPGYSWSKKGHQMVAAIASVNLTPETKKRLRDYVKGLKEKVGEDEKHAKGFVEQAALLDDIKHMDISKLEAMWSPLNKNVSVCANFETWGQCHYLDHPHSVDGVSIPENSTEEGIMKPGYVSAYMALEDAKKVFKQKDASREALLFSYLIVIHVMGDLHAPQHNSDIYSGDFPNGSRGGNEVNVKLGKKTKNLHQIWDDVKLHKEKKTELQLAKEWMEEFSFDEKERNRDDFLNISKEADTLAFKYVYLDGALKTKKVQLPSNYMSNKNEVSKKQIVLAGYRLAYFLNQYLPALRQ